MDFKKERLFLEEATDLRDLREKVIGILEWYWET